MANHVSHAALPYPVKGARFTLDFVFYDATGAITNPSGAVTESLNKDDSGATAGGTENFSISTSALPIGGYLTLTGDETNCSLLKVRLDTPNTLPAYAVLYPRVLPVLHGGSAAGGTTTTITLENTAPTVQMGFIGSIVKTTGGPSGSPGPAGGGSGSRDNQARVITAYSGGTRIATVSPAWEVPPVAGTIYEVLMTEYFYDANVALIKAKTDSLTFTGFNVHSQVEAGTISGTLDAPALAAIGVATETEINDRLLSVDSSARLERSTRAIAYGTTNNCPSSSSIITTSMSPLAKTIDQFKNGVLIFDSSTTHVDLRGQRAEVTASTIGDNICTLTIAPPLTLAPASGNTFTII